VEECKKRWRSLRDGYMRSKRVGALHKTKVSMFEKLQFLNDMLFDGDEAIETMEVIEEPQIQDESLIGAEQQVITDNQEYYEVFHCFLLLISILYMSSITLSHY
jgi:hypothetical protein